MSAKYQQMFKILLHWISNQVLVLQAISVIVQQQNPQNRMLLIIKSFIWQQMLSILQEII